jgi:ABC-2 type transport system ATP-binding protein
VSSASIWAQGLSRRFGDELAMVDLDLEVAAGEVVALVGLNGAGKSTLMRLLLGMLRPDSGTVKILGHPVTHADRTVWSQVGHLIENPPRYDELTVVESVYSAARLQGLDRRAARSAADQTITQLELGHWQSRATRTLSLGNRQRLGIAMAMVHEPSVLILDEPSNSLDPLGVVRVRELLRDRASVHGAAILVSSHHLDEVARMADRIVLLHRGRALGELDPAGADVEREFFARVLVADRARPGVL